MTLSESSEEKQYRAVLVVHTDATHRVRLEEACRRAGVPVLGVSSVSEVEQWPVGQIVVTDAAHLTPWWRVAGAVEVLVLVQDATEGIAALEKGATQWLRRTSTPAAVAATVRVLAGRGSSGRAGA